MKVTPPPVITRFLQVCVATPDLDETCSQLAAYGISPFKVWRFRPPVLFDRRFRGREADFTMDLAIAWAGTLQVEVVQPVSGSSLAAEFLAANEGPGLWHVMVGMPGSWKRRVASLSAAFGEPAQSAAVAVPVKLGPLTIPPPPGKTLRGAGATRFAYFNAVPGLGTTIEVSKFPAGLSLRAASALGKADRVLDDAGSKTKSRISGLGISVGDVDAAERTWTKLLPSALWSSPSSSPIRTNVLRRAQLGGVQMDLFEREPNVVGGAGYLRFAPDSGGSDLPAGSLSVSGVPVFVDPGAD